MRSLFDPSALLECSRALARSALTALMICNSANAALGDPSTALAGDATALRSELATVDRSAYSAATLALPAGTVVREFFRPDGSIFAVSWSGARPPDLSLLLGRYYDEYRAALEIPRSQIDHRHLAIETTHLVVHQTGHMRDLHGMAYMPSLLPQGLAPGALQ